MSIEFTKAKDLMHYNFYSQFKKNQTVHLPDGREVKYICGIGKDGHVVRLFVGCGEEHILGEAIVVPTVFAEEPTDVYSAAVREQREKLTRLQEETRTVQSDLQELTKQKEELLSQAAKYPSIQTVIDFVEGRITHVVTYADYRGWEVKTLEEALDCDGVIRYNRGLRLLSLFGVDIEKKQQWKMNQYSDGSGSWVEVMPMRSLDEAKRYVTDRVRTAMLAYLSDPKKGESIRSRIAGTLERNDFMGEWFDPPKEWVEYMEARKEAIKANKIAKLREELSAIEDE